ncbi:transmembrane amino acid transporter [Nitzschia inconspicua]|uniref:Transmembrane amino acid transporter n=1 Tax=Nitzschia inconspicua TaxID=303405 RepID=A0A9K3PBX9_9STRA|nr:transmembrane amino acid transporter [Nitzschia inconspicua]
MTNGETTVQSTLPVVGGGDPTADFAGQDNPGSTPEMENGQGTLVGHPNNHHNDDENPSDEVRIGTISSARFNILSTMVGGGCLSLPLAFQQSGNALTGPLMLLGTAVLTDFCFRLLVATSVHLHPPQSSRPGKDTFESITSVAFGAKAYVFSMGLVVLMCFFGAVGYSVLLRDMMEPVNDAIAPHFITSPWLYKNFTMFLVIFFVTPFCTLRNLTALKDCGAASMVSVLILGSCIVFRSVECNLKTDDTGEPWYKYLTLFPESWRDLLDVLPLFISCFVCHYNILPVHNELKDPSPARVSWWLRSTLLFSCTIYIIIGFAGSAYAKCTPGNKIHGNILLDFDKKDPLLMVGRMCLAVTITLAFPMLVIPARDILLRSLIFPIMTKTGSTVDGRLASETVGGGTLEELERPLLQDDEEEIAEPSPSSYNTESESEMEGRVGPTISNAPIMILLSTSVVIFWSAGALASSVASIEIVWDLLGSSLSILLSYLIPAGTYLVITKVQTDLEEQSRPYTARQYWSRMLCWALLWTFFPLMIVSTTNAIINTFFK